MRGQSWLVLSLVTAAVVSGCTATAGPQITAIEPAVVDNSAPVVLSIKGTGFDPAASVLFGEAADFPRAVRTPSLAQIELPAAYPPAVYRVFLRNPDGRQSNEVTLEVRQAACGNGQCEAGETARTCPADCDRARLAACAPSNFTRQKHLELAEDRGNFLVFNADDSFRLRSSVTNWDEMMNWYKVFEEAYLAIHPDTSHFVFFLDDISNTCCSHRQLSNTVRGIGMDHWNFSLPDGTQFPSSRGPLTFDGTPTALLEGIIYLGGWELYREDYRGYDRLSVGNERLDHKVLHEFGHRWLGYAYYRAPNGSIMEDMPAREKAHWNFYLNTGRSPVDGMDWVDNGDGTFTAENKLKLQSDGYIFGYSDLDLYLMGLMPAEEVQPWFIIDNPRNCLFDGEPAPCPDPKAPSFAAHPKFTWNGKTVTVTGDRRNITIQDVIAAEGPRNPEYQTAMKNHNITFILFKGSKKTLSQDEYAEMDRIVRRAQSAWSLATRGRSRLVNDSKGFCWSGG